ncbi:hypothetical protein QS257_11870 [Terrilactibacillus sp. S3-3]|nr:hypothetical protein QS257_11870 [Terrilactibacillus sp. S3-3]
MNFAPMQVNLLGFKVNTMDRSATLSFGPIQQLDIFQANKRNQGFGEENGDLVGIYLPISYVFDPDGLDSNAAKGSAI